MRNSWRLGLVEPAFYFNTILVRSHNIAEHSTSFPTQLFSTIRKKSPFNLLTTKGDQNQNSTNFFNFIVRNAEKQSERTFKEVSFEWSHGEFCQKTQD